MSRGAAAQFVSLKWGEEVEAIGTSALDCAFFQLRSPSSAEANQGLPRQEPCAASAERWGHSGDDVVGKRWEQCGHQRVDPLHCELLTSARSGLCLPLALPILLNCY